MIRFGVIGAGNIARNFCEAANGVDATLYAVASRDLDKAERYKETYGFVQAYDNYETLFKDPLVDCVYIATPHGLHYDHMMSALSYGKHVLCEKAFTLNEAQAEEVLKKAIDNHCFVMEALWTRFLPTIQDVVSIVKDGVIGKVTRLEVDFCFKTEASDDSRLFNPALGGGALLDIGIYPLTMANLILGRPISIESEVTMYKTGVDYSERIIYHYEGAEAILNASFAVAKPADAMIKGTKGHILVPNFFYAEKAYVYDENNHLMREINHQHLVNGMEYEIIETIDCIQTKRLESAVMPHAETLAIMRQMDELRKSWKLVYPHEHLKVKG